MLRSLIPVVACLLLTVLSARADSPKPLHAEVKMLNGAPAVFVNGKPIFPMGFVRSMWIDDKYIKEMRDAGVHVYMDGMGYDTEGTGDYSGIDAFFEHFVSIDPNALFVPRIQVDAIGKWLDANPEERCKYSDGTFGPVSIASEPWKKDAGEDLAAMIKHVRGSKYADRVLGFLICSGYSSEWQSWGLWDGKIGDFSEPAVKAFRKWLTAKYKTDNALRKAWKDPSVSLETVTIPTPNERRASSAMFFRDPQKDGMRITDFYEFYSNTTADTIIHFARVVKEASDGDMLAGFFYGYLNQYGSLQPESAHNAVTKVVNCPEIDFFASPACYSDRQPGGTSNFMTMAESIGLHGKVHFDESDIRTHLTKLDQVVGRCNTPEETFGVLKREMGQVLARAQTLWWFDMAGGWFSDERVMSLIKQLKTAADQSLSRLRAGSAEIAVFLDDKSNTVFSPTGNTEGLPIELMVLPVVSWPRVGAPQDYYLLSDITHPKMPRHKLYVFVNAFWVSDRQIKAIHDRLKRDHATALWIYAPGYVGDKGLSVERMKELTGINLVRVSSAVSSRIRVNPSHKLAKGEKWTGTIGTDKAYGPIFYADDPDAEVVGKLESLNKPGFVIKQMDGWTSVFYASPTLPYKALRAVAEYAGVHIFSRSNDCFYANRGIVALHASEAGEKEIRLPKKSKVSDLLTGEVIAKDTNIIKLNIAAKDTALLRVE